MSAATPPSDVPAFFHVNLNCSDFDRSRRFYEAIGFEMVLDFEKTGGGDFGAAGLGPVLRLPDDCRGRAGLFMLRGDRHGPRLDLIEWRSPKEPAAPHGTLARPGFGRLCLRTLDADAVHDRLADLGHPGYTRPAELVVGGSVIRVFCVEDPDGTVIEFMQFVRRADAANDA